MSVFEDILEHVRITDEKYLSLYRKDIKTHPIPFFGNISTAKVITLGVNPSAEEFIQNRQWRQPCDLSYLQNRLLNYFNWPVPPHPFFYRWEACLKILGYSYFRNAAHIDLSPRATKCISNIKDKSDNALFIDMIKKDITFLKNILNQCTRTKLILTAGAVNKRYWLYECLKNNFTDPSHGLELNGDARREQGSPWSKMLQLKTPTRQIPLFFTTTGPSARRNNHYLNAQITQWKAQIIAQVGRRNNIRSKTGENQRNRGSHLYGLLPK